MHGTEDITPPAPLPEIPHLLVPSCSACRKSKRTCVVTTAVGNKSRICDQCRRAHRTCVSEDTEADQGSLSVGKKRRRVVAEELNGSKGKNPRRQSNEETETWDGQRVDGVDNNPLHVTADTKQDTGNTSKDGCGRNILGVEGARGPVHLSTGSSGHDAKKFHLAVSKTVESRHRYSLHGSSTVQTDISGCGNPFVSSSRGVIPKTGSASKLLNINIVDVTPRKLRPPRRPPHSAIPTCRACRVRNRSCVITVIAGNRNRRCDYCRRTLSECVFEETEPDQTPEDVGKRRRRTCREDSGDPKGKKPRRQPSEDSEEVEILDGPWVGEENVNSLQDTGGPKRDVENAVKNDGRRNTVGVAGVDSLTRLETEQVLAGGAKEASGKTVQDEGRGNMPEVIDAHRLARLETTLQEVAANTTALTEAVTRNMTAIAEERRERTEYDRKTSETMNLMLKVMYKIVNAGSLPSASP
ncbi:hypothetical protein EV401DRAFT_478214 [Pisolithus croceorrhizus]|nr:hypothetical protein EV401DRAFT_478214 [Pisolithus croceorrhizus]